MAEVSDNILQEFIAEIRNIRDEYVSVMESIAAMEKNGIAFEQTLKQNAEDARAMNKKLLAAFPAEDVEGHARYHGLMIERAERVNRILGQASEKLAMGGMIALGWWVLTAIIAAVKHDLAKFLNIGT